MARVYVPLPDTDFDPTEVAVPWSILREAGHEVVFATETGAPGTADPVVIRGPSALFPSMRIGEDARATYGELAAAPELRAGLRWRDVRARDVDAVFLPGGHAQGMKPYLESAEVQQVVLAKWRAGAPVGAICHGVLVLARTIDPDTGASVLRGRRSTCLPRYMERIAYYLTAWKLGRYYKTYSADVEEEVRAALGPDGTFERGPIHLVAKGSATDDRAAFVVEDGPYVSARWPGDAFLIARRFAERLAQRDVATSAA